MTVQRDPDAILAAWLEEGPTGLPEPSRRAIAVNTRTTTQRRRPLWMPWRKPVMNTYARWAVAALAIVIAVGGRCVPPCAWRQPGRRYRRPQPRHRQPHPLRPGRPRRPPKPRRLGRRRARPSSRTKASSTPGPIIPQFDPPLAFTIDREVEHNCAPDFQCRGSIDANLPGWVDLEFGLPRIEMMHHPRRQGRRPRPQAGGSSIRRLTSPPGSPAGPI